MRIWKAPKSGQKMPKTAIRSRLKFDRNLFYECAMKLLFFPKITVIQAHGFLLGASMDMYMLCDFIVGAEDCKFADLKNRKYNEDELNHLIESWLKIRTNSQPEAAIGVKVTTLPKT